MTSMRLSSLPSFAVVRKQTEPLRTVNVGPIQVAATWDSSMLPPQAPKWCGYYHNVQAPASEIVRLWKCKSVVFIYNVQ